MVIGPEDRRWTRLRKLFDELYELAPERRDEALTRLAREDAELARELAPLLTEADDDWLAPLGWNKRVGEWRLEGERAGSDAGVYRACHASSGQRAALRVLALDGLTAVTRLRELVPRLVRFRHEEFAGVLEVGLCQAPDETRAAVYIVEELVEPARALVEHLGDSALPDSERVTSLARACEAVRDLHSQELVHGRLDRTTLGIDARGRPCLRALGVGPLSPAGGSLGPADDLRALSEALSVLAGASRSGSGLGALLPRLGALGAAEMANELRKLATPPHEEPASKPLRGP